MEATQNQQENSVSQNPHLSLVAVLPGPRNGMTLMTEVIVDAMGEHYSLRVYDIGQKFTKPGKGWVARKAWQSFLSAVRILFWKPRPNERLYLVLNATGGLIYNIWQAAAGRLRGFPMVVHHHVWSYLSQSDWRMRLLLRILGPKTIHAVHCPEMSAAMEETYGQEFRFAYVTPGIVGLPEFDQPKQAASETFVIGTLSNLTIEKGLDEAIDTFEELKSRGHKVRLVLGGPAASADAKARIESAIKQHGDLVEHRGPIYGDDKRNFFAELDAFVFPTKYRNESWGIVLNEALMAGVPVITYRRGCTGYLVGEKGGLVVQDVGDFVSAASDLIEQWINDPAELSAARQRALDRGGELRDHADAQFVQFLKGFQTDCWPTADGGKVQL